MSMNETLIKPNTQASDKEKAKMRQLFYFFTYKNITLKG